MNIWEGLLLLGGYLPTGHVAALAAEEIELERALAEDADRAVVRTPGALVSEFLRVVRSGLDPARAAEFLADEVIAHQLNAEQPEATVRTPASYAEHIEEFRHLYGDFRFEVTELLADGDKVYARWIQRGHHLGVIDGHRPTWQPVVEYASAVYRVKDNRIQEYWIQIDRAGLQAQLRAHTNRPQLSACA